MQYDVRINQYLDNIHTINLCLRMHVLIMNLLCNSNEKQFSIQVYAFLLICIQTCKMQLELSIWLKTFLFVSVS